MHAVYFGVVTFWQTCSKINMNTKYINNYIYLDTLTKFNMV